MVMTKVVPALTEVVWQDSATDVAGAEDDDFSYTPPSNGIKPAHTRTLDTAKSVSLFHTSCLLFPAFRPFMFIQLLMTL
ncbi:hypothetical protein YC2023_060970 [Brassica napus]